MACGDELRQVPCDGIGFPIYNVYRGKPYLFLYIEDGVPRPPKEEGRRRMGVLSRDVGYPCCVME